MTPQARWLAVAAVLTVAVAVPAARFARVLWAEYRSFCPARVPVQTEAATARVPGLRPVSWAGPAGEVRAWYAPGTNRGAVLLLHGWTGSRNDVVDDMAILARAGFSVLAFDWPGHGESGGCSQWDTPERETIGQAVDWLAARPEVRADRIGAFGFSMGGYALVQRGATDPRIRAFVLAGVPSDMRVYSRWEYRDAGPWSQVAVRLAARVRRMRLDEQVAVTMVDRLAPRPVLVVIGDADRVVHPSIMRPLYDAAREPKELLVVPGAHHGDYAVVAPELYGNRLTTFFTSALLHERPAGDTE